MTKKYLCIVMLVLLTTIVSCGNPHADTTDYSQEEHWAFLPKETQYSADVFFVAPTCFSGEDMNMDIADEETCSSIVVAAAMEKGLYDDRADFYSPLYREMSMRGYELPEEERETYLEIAFADVDAAFTYYMAHYNNGKPVILAGFSQGADMVKRLLENHEELGEQLIAAYIIGWNVTDQDLEQHPWMKMAEGEDDTGVIISYCSESPELMESVIVPNHTNGINPINWKTDGTPAEQQENPGSCFTDYSGQVVTEIPALCGAYLDLERGTLKVTGVTPEEFPARLHVLKEGNYHLYDYEFFYRSVEENVQHRITSWEYDAG